MKPNRVHICFYLIKKKLLQKSKELFVRLMTKMLSNRVRSNLNGLKVMISI